jgi:hypothetical protein
VSRARAVVVPAASVGMMSGGMISIRPRRRGLATSARFDDRVSEPAQLAAIAKAAAKRLRKGARRVT